MKVRVKHLIPGDVLAATKDTVCIEPFPSKYNPGYYYLEVKTEKGSVLPKIWKPNTTVSILDK